MKELKQRPTSPEAYIDLIKQAIFEVEDLRAETRVQLQVFELEVIGVPRGLVDDRFHDVS